MSYNSPKTTWCSAHIGQEQCGQPQEIGQVKIGKILDLFPSSWTFSARPLSSKRRSRPQKCCISGYCMRVQWISSLQLCPHCVFSITLRLISKPRDSSKNKSKKIKRLIFPQQQRTGMNTRPPVGKCCTKAKMICSTHNTIVDFASSLLL